MLCNFFDGTPGNSSLIYTYTDDGFPMNPILASSGLITVRFISDGSVQMSGFTLWWTSSSLCLEDCSFNGYCILDKCDCTNGWSGNICDQVSPLNLLYPGVLHYDFVPEFEWKFFYVDVVEPEEFLLIDAARITYPVPPKKRWGGGHPVFYLRYNYFPTKTQYDAMAVYDQNQNLNVTGLYIKNPPLGRYAVGVYGLEASGFTLFLNSFVHKSSGITPTVQDTRGGFIAGMVFLALGIVVIIGALVAVGVWYRRKRSGMTFNEMHDRT